MNKNFFKVFIAMLLTFVCKRIMQQIDLIMIAPFGESELAAYSAPMNMNILDFALYLSLAAILTVRIAKVVDDKGLFKREVSNVISLAICMGAFISIASVYIYSFFISVQIIDAYVQSLAQSIVGWSAVTIIPDSFCLLLSIVAFVAHKECQAALIALIAIVLDAVLNYVFAYAMSLGFVGIFIATFVARAIEAILFLYILRKIIVFREIKLVPEITWVKKLFLKSFPEFIRILLERANLFTVFWLLNRQVNVVDKLSVFSVVTSIRLLFAMVIIAYARAITITLSKKYERFDSKAKAWVTKISVSGLIGIIIISYIVWAGTDFLAKTVFKLDGEVSSYWWRSFTSMFIILFMADYISLVFRAILNYMEQFKLAAIYDLILLWVILLPIIVLALDMNNPYMIWIGYISVSVLFVIMSLFYVRRNHAHH